jgi:hypothetical protein
VISPTFGGSQSSDPGFNEALGELRAVVRIELAHIAAAFGLDAEEPLSTILPEPDQDADAALPSHADTGHRRSRLDRLPRAS